LGASVLEVDKATVEITMTITRNTCAMCVRFALLKKVNKNLKANNPIKDFFHELQLIAEIGQTI
ncbi:MAG: hypothetical protein ACKO2X_02760, partial [Bacteroidota bacterium]